MLKIKNLLLLFFMSLYNFTFAQPRDVKVKIKNIPAIEGKIYIAVFDDKDHFLIEGKECQMIVLDVNDNEMICKVHLPEGECAFALYHDRNSDGICNRNKIGIPLEPYAFSNNFKPRLKAPSFNQAKITGNPDFIEINLINR